MSASAMRLPPTSISPCSGMTRTSEALLGSISWAWPCGRFTLRPDFFSTSDWLCSSATFFFSSRASTWTASALTMKIITSTRKTSVSGVMLISAKIESPPSSPPASSSGSFPIAIAITLRARLDVACLFVFGFDLLGAARLRIAGLLEQELEELVGQQLHFRCDAARALAEEVEQDDG